MTGFELYLKRNSKKFDDYLSTFFGNGTHPDMGRYLYAPLAAYSANAGKRHRPLICLLACEAVGGDPKGAWPTAAAVEHFHTAALIHDDIEDSSLTRRGEPCMHVVEGDGLAINAGDLALSLVTGTVVDDPGLDDATKLQGAARARGHDHAHHRGPGARHRLGARRPLRPDRRRLPADGEPQDRLLLGRGAAGCREHHRRRHREQTETLRGFGMAAGLAFQIQDDMLNLVGTRESTKKDFRSDITEGKRTLVAVHALQNSPERERMLEILSARETDPAVLAEAVGDHARGRLDRVRERIRARARGRRKAALEGALAQEPRRDLLGSMADFFVKRNS